MSLKQKSAEDLYEKIKSGDELALIDVREHGVYSQGHPLFSISIPLSRFELEIERMVPRLGTPVVLFDQGGTDDLASRAANILDEMGYRNVSVLTDGVSGWHSAGFEVFSGVNVPSKAFGEFVEHSCNTPRITAETLNRRLSDGEKIAIFDSRPFEEFHRMCIPGGVDMPGAELAHRFQANIPDDTTPVVVNCAGRTRSIIGAQSLINAGVRNPVMALKDGTMGWYLEGYDLEHNADRVASLPSPEEYTQTLDRAKALAEQTGASAIGVAQLKSLQENASDRSLFLLDVRTAEEFEAGHLVGSQHAPGGQLVQATDEYVGVRGAILVLIDDREIRGWMTASWLKQMGWPDVYVFSDLQSAVLEHGAQKQVAVSEGPSLSPLELKAVLQSGEPAAVIDLSNSLQFAKSHIPGSYWMIRSRLGFDLNLLPAVGLVILTAEDERLAHLTASEIVKKRPEVIVRILKGGNKAWRDSGLEVESGGGHHLSATDDVWYKPYDNKDKIRERMQEYLDWEIGLIAQIERDATARFEIIC